MLTFARERAQLPAVRAEQTRRVVRAEREAVVAFLRLVLRNQIPRFAWLLPLRAEETELALLEDEEESLRIPNVLAEQRASVSIDAVSERHVDRSVRAGINARVDVLLAYRFYPFKRQIISRHIFYGETAARHGDDCNYRYRSHGSHYTKSW